MKANYLTSRNLVKALSITALFILLTIPKLVLAQSVYKVVSGPTTSIKVLGTSNVHDWVLTSPTMESKGNFKFDTTHQLTELTDFNFELNAKSLKSEHNSMDTRTYKAIKADENPKITYNLNWAIVKLVAKNKYLINTTGQLTIAGKSKTIAMDVNAVINEDGSITCTGTQKIKLTDYGITPPSFMLGSMKVYDDLTIQFNLIYKK